jgi:gliding motility-associated-like protein
MDTMRVNNTWPHPSVLLPNAPILCVGASQVLDAGLQARYLWQDGSTGQQLTIADTGTYKVSVWDSHGCNSSDSVHVAQFSPLPVGFLPADTAMCSYDVLTLAVNQRFSAYAWSTGDQTASIQVKSPGTYILQVEDGLGCTGTDSVVVGLKECLSGFNMPNAFTPNGDGLNDLIRPIVGGRVEAYSFVIFDRWGKKVFQSSDLTAGWDGRFQGQPEPTQTYSWVCHVKWAGAKVQQYKGTLTLIR